MLTTVDATVSIYYLFIVGTIRAFINGYFRGLGWGCVGMERFERKQEILTKNILFFYMALNLLCLIEPICTYIFFLLSNNF